eukprot:CAMPEP_0198145518 /NCGR_PEP_ID=MMETSP1443-20131203/24077_1 /TAXON_ID=186043 /ORGANISM="Entomoneis sp., Strain CCMP2396" /LENGTH=36 /DNA_ID= /DNA_START= /DNA_END= /DNA_ORIENTATION=
MSQHHWYDATVDDPVLCQQLGDYDDLAPIELKKQVS